MLAGAYVALLQAPSSYDAPTFLPLSGDPYALLIRVLKWTLAACLIREINSMLNAWAENRWLVTNDKSSWQWNQELAVVTGGSNGIGAAVVKELVSHGVKVAVLDIQSLSEAFQNDESDLVSFYQCDLTSRDAVHRAAEALRSDHGSPSILINNAGIANSCSILDLSPKLLQTLVGLNLISHWYIVQEFLPDMLAKRKGHIMSTASMAAFLGMANAGDYAATKAALTAFHETLTQELKHRYKVPQIKTSIVYPFWTRTRLNVSLDGQFRKTFHEVKDVAKIMVNQIIAARSGQLILGPKLAPFVRVMPMWLQEAVRDTQAYIIPPENVTTAVGVDS
ncbi:NAD(P)-binding protein [Bimuria novae-zelandiae CBS 107.79]|uniref:NAD(P)-binding protein n=1 Tax=Bimuria novae-zelandiae CBS 107.79 TaxID=1447943 RepID=A0A6A5VJI7_9PLEO|nr:NAD(P)-binding protein [Bimuria novae-zelandiae CBS 107.79]